MEEQLSSILELFSKYPYLRTVLLSFLLLVFFAIVRKIIFNRVNKRAGRKHEKILIQKKVSQYLFYLLMICVFFLWFTQLQVFFVSMFAVAAAFVIAFKELIMCVTGGTLINISHLFKLGDRIEIDSFRGFVIEKNLLTTKILEIGPEKNSQQTTGDIIAVPNSLMLSKGLKNESYFKGYSIKSFVYKVSDESKIDEFEKQILIVSERFCAGYLEEAKKGISKFCEKEGLVVPSINPKTKIIVEEGKDFSVLVKLPIRNTEIADIEQELNRFYLLWRKNIKQSKKNLFE